jgi:hypothetical protein
MQCIYDLYITKSQLKLILSLMVRRVLFAKDKIQRILSLTLFFTNCDIIDPVCSLCVCRACDFMRFLEPTGLVTGKNSMAVSSLQEANLAKFRVKRWFLDLVFMHIMFVVIFFIIYILIVPTIVPVNW